MVPGTGALINLGCGGEDGAGAGGGVNSDFFGDEELLPNYSVIENSNINGAVKVSGLNSCWLGIIRNQVRGNIVDTNNTFFDEDANELVLNASKQPDPVFGEQPGGGVRFRLPAIGLQHGPRRRARRELAASDHHVTARGRGDAAGR